MKGNNKIKERIKSSHMSKGIVLKESPYNKWQYQGKIRSLEKHLNSPIPNMSS